MCLISSLSIIFNELIRRRSNTRARTVVGLDSIIAELIRKWYISSARTIVGLDPIIAELNRKWYISSAQTIVGLDPIIAELRRRKCIISVSNTAGGGQNFRAGGSNYLARRPNHLAGGPNHLARTRIDKEESIGRLFTRTWFRLWVRNVLSGILKIRGNACSPYTQARLVLNFRQGFCIFFWKSYLYV